MSTPIINDGDLITGLDDDYDYDYEYDENDQDDSRSGRSGKSFDRGYSAVFGTAFGHYLGEIGQIDLLTPEQEHDLFKTIDDGRIAQQQLDEAVASGTKLAPSKRRELNKTVREGQAARVHAIEANLRLVVSISKQFYYSLKNPSHFHDIVQDGNIGLITAVDKFDYKLGYRFSTYATWWIKQSITRRTPVYMYPMTVSADAADKARQYSRAIGHITSAVKRMPTDEELCDFLGFTSDQVALYKRLLKPAQSLDVPLKPGLFTDKDGGITLACMLADDSPDADVFECSVTGVANSVLMKALDQFSPRDKGIMIDRYGLDGREPRTLAEIGDELGLTRERVRQITNKCLKKLRADPAIKRLYTAL